MRVFVPASKGHKKGSCGRRFCMYSVYDNKTDFPIVIDATAEDCAAALKRSLNSFYCLVSRVFKGKNKRYAVLRRYLDEEE
ncbi:MAG: hypothetical protein IJ017_07960 [Oscillospiraceae bacterium]|nr:hypothetical protein [Oscillospiraceae bacterium]